MTLGNECIHSPTKSEITMSTNGNTNQLEGILAKLDLKPLTHGEALAAIVGQSGFNLLVDMPSITYVGFDAAHNTLVAQLVVGDKHLNTWGTLHGGMIATLVDVITSIAICEAGHPTTGMSVELSASYVKAAPNGSTIVVVAEVERIGGNLAFSRCQLFTSVNDGGFLVASGRHTKFIGGQFVDRKRGELRPAAKL
ncbi:HotDog domain-containing protein [Catenaria anguillulae PL171]|uniref:HotDog domain-containing protein n=1 Tax=Catenaria anguillulae PL171 TaxID=765915 RepID=A0A1Y2H494_9FUNG|nr:HotDog domain-containing protein [Catenaria anguillulae PL171]